MTLRQIFVRNKSLIYAILIPLVSSILPICIRQKPAYCGFVLFVMSGFWITECLPIAITSLLPVVLFPIFGILDSKSTSKIYFEDINMLFLGSLVMALTIEKTQLHERIALRVIMLFGSNPKWLLLGIMLVTSFLSLWVSNTAAASMMLPIVVEIVNQLVKTKKDLFTEEDTNNSKKKIHLINAAYEMENFEDKASVDKAETTVEVAETTSEHNVDEHKTASEKMIKGFCLSISYSASIGGTGSLVGTSPNLLLKGYYDEHYPEGGLNFLTYMIIALPIAMLVVLFSWLWLVYLWFPRKYLFSFRCKTNKNKNKEKVDELKQLMKEKYKSLNPISWEQISVGCIFMLLVLLWITRDLYVIPGWGQVFEKGYVTDTTAAIFVVILLVIWPRKNVFKGEDYEHLISWQKISESFPWYILLLGGGGLALAEGFQKSKLSEWIGQVLTDVVPANETVILIVIIFFAQIGTEFTSNSSMESILLPVIDALAVKYNMNPSFLLIPLTISVSLAFLLPIASPTNAVVFASGYLKTKDMILSGIMVKIIGVSVVLLISCNFLNMIFHNPNFTTREASLFSNATTTLNVSNVLLM